MKKERFINIDVQKFINRVAKDTDKLWHEIGSFIEGHDFNPSPDSPAMKEIVAFPREDLVATAYAQGRMRIQAAANHYLSFTRTLQDPVLAIATWACARAVVETSALAAWLLAPGIDVSERVRRSYAVRFEGLRHQRSLAKGDYVSDLWDRTEELALEAAALGYAIREEKGRRVGVTPKLPSFTDLAKQFGRENFYRTASGMTHGFDFAVMALAMSYGSEREVGGAFSPGMEIATQVSTSFTTVNQLCRIVASAYVKAAATLSQLYGWDELRLLDFSMGHSAALHEAQSELVAEMFEASKSNDKAEGPSST